MNQVYEHWNLLRNHFHPSFKLKSKEKQGSRYEKRYEPPRTPYQRLLEAPGLSTAVRHQLKEQHRQLNTFELKKSVEQELIIFFTALGNLNCEATNP